VAIFDADIALKVLTDKAFKSIDEIERRIGKIEDNSVELKVKGFQQANRAVESLKKNLKTLGRIGVGALGVEGVGAASKALNELSDTIASTERASGLGSSAINAVLDPIRSLGESAVQATAPLAGLFDGINSLAAAGDGTGLAIGAASAALVAFAGPIDAARKKVQELVLGVNNLQMELSEFKDVEQAGRSGVLAEIEAQLNDAVRAAKNLDSATGEYAATLRRIIQLEAERNSELAKRSALTASERTRQGIGVIGTSGLDQISQNALPSAEMLAKRLKESGQEVQRLSRYYGDLNVDIDLGAQNAAEFTAELREAASRGQQLPPIFSQVERALKATVERTGQFVKVQRGANALFEQRLKLVQAELLATSLVEQKNRQNLQNLKNEIAAQRQITEEIKERARAEKLQKSSKFLDNLLTGAGFPLLFGGGPGAVGGGLLGAAFSGGGFGGQIFVGALGQALDRLVVQVSDLGRAINDLDFARIIEAAGLAGTETAAFIDELNTLYGAEVAARTATEILSARIGEDAVESLRAFGESTQALQNAVSQLTTEFAALAASLLGPVSDALTSLISRSNGINAANRILQEGGPDAERIRAASSAAGPDLQDRIDAEIAAAQEITAEREAAARAEASLVAVRDESVALLQQEISLREMGGDVLDENVLRETERLALNEKLIDDQKLYTEYAKGQLSIQALRNGLLKNELTYKGKLLDIEEEIARLTEKRDSEAERAAQKAQRDADRAARQAERAAEREKRRQEQQAKLYNNLKSQLEKQYAFAQDISDLERERLSIQFDYVKILERAKEIENETLRLAVEKNALIVRDARLAQATRDAQEPFENLKEEITFLREKLTLGEREAQIRKEIRDIEEATGGTVRAEAIEKEVRARADLNDQLTEQKALEEQIDALYKQLGTTVVSVFDDLINSTKSFNEIMADTLRQLSSFLLQAGFNALGNSAGQGSVLNTLFGTRAMGGPVSAGQPYLVGERGPELFVPSQSGGIMANSKMGGGEVNYVQNIYITDDGSSSEGDAGELGRLIESSVVGIIQREKRPGGMLG
jgi:hypothetical protein